MIGGEGRGGKEKRGCEGSEREEKEAWSEADGRLNIVTERQATSNRLRCYLDK